MAFRNRLTRYDARGSKGNEAGRGVRPRVGFIVALCVFLSLPLLTLGAQDQANSKDPAGMKRYEGSRLIGYRAPRFDEYLMPLGPITGSSPIAFEKSQPLEGQVSFYTYLAPAGRSPAELFRNYKLEFQRLNIDIQYEKKAGEGGWFGNISDKLTSEPDLSQMLGYNEAEERLLIGKSRDPKPSYYLVFVTGYKDGTVPDRLQGKVAVGQALATLVVVTADTMEKKMSSVNADDKPMTRH